MNQDIIILLSTLIPSSLVVYVVAFIKVLVSIKKLKNDISENEEAHQARKEVKELRQQVSLLVEENIKLKRTQNRLMEVLTNVKQSNTEE